jgi:spore germination protein KA
MATFARIMRVFGLIFAVTAPGIYVALQSYNYRILPINFLISILSSIEGLSIPPLIEILVVLFLFEIITEASLQMPNSLAMALSIIGALALGNTAVDAGIISPPSIVVVATSSVALYVIPDEISENRLMRILFTLLGGIIGLYGVVTAFIIIVSYLTSIKSFGVPYFVPYAPDIKSDKKDAFIKQDVQSMKTRPRLLVNKNIVRQKAKEKHK